ncbi:MAG: DUF1385 domain-containing protein [Lachnospiraceae bacterium]
MKSSGIGGQAVLEGVMMRHKNDIAVAVRKPDGNIEVGRQKTVSPKEKCKVLGWPVIRGVAAFISSLIIGIKTLSFSASFYMDEEEAKKENKKNEGAMMFGAVAFSLVLGVGIFILLPFWGAEGLMKLLGSESAVLRAVIEGVLKLGIFIGYVSLISLMKDIKRTYMYHGAEHKCISCIESGRELVPDNVMDSSKEHRRCGTSFIFFVLFISIIFFIFLRFDSLLIRLAVRLALVPVIAGISFEFIQWTGNSNTVIAGILSKPGLWIQALTTKEPTRDMVEVAIAAVEGVFDWRAYLREQGIEVSGQAAGPEEQ